jgi:cytochrome c553
MKTTLVLLAVSLLVGAGVAQAANSAGSVDRGSAKAFFCTGCHGYNGMGSASAPELAGKSVEEMSAMLGKYQKQKGSLMGSVVAKFSEADLNDLSAYFASLKKTVRGEASYARDVQPIIIWRCIACHAPEGEGAAKSGLNLTSYEGLMAGTKQGGALIEAGSSTSSTFMVMLTRKDHLRMPHGAAPLSDDELRVIRTWIDQGAKNN